MLFIESALTTYYNFNHSNTQKNCGIFEKYAYHIWMEQLSLRLAFRFLHTIIVMEGLVRPQVEHWLSVVDAIGRSKTGYFLAMRFVLFWFVYILPL